MRYAIIALLTACNCTTPGPEVVIHLESPAEWSANDREMARSVGSVWRDLDLTWRVTDDPTRAEKPCGDDWTTSGESCTIDIGVSKVVNLKADYGYTGAADRATHEVVVEASKTGFVLLHLIAHESGHIVFDTSKHTDAGVMAPASYDIDPTDLDFDLACETIARACR